MPHIEIAKNTLYQLLGKIASAIVGLLLTILIAHFYGASGYGSYTKITFFVTTCYLLIDFGINPIYLLEEKKISFSALIGLRVVMATVVYLFLNISLFVFGVFGNNAFPQIVRMGVLIFSLSFFAQAITLSTAARFQKILNYKKLVVSQLIGSLCSLALCALVSSLFLPLNYLILCLLVGGFVTSIIAFINVGEDIRIKLPSKPAYDLLWQSLPLALVLLCNLVYFRADIFLLSIFRSSSEVGIYGYAYRYFDFLITLPLFLSSSIYPILINAKIKDSKGFKFKYTVLYLAIGILISIMAFIFSPLVAFVKADFAYSVLPLRILLVSLPVFFITSFLQWQLIAKKRLKYLLFVYVFSAVINIILNFKFIPTGGYLSAAWITDISELIVFVLLIARL